MKSELIKLLDAQELELKRCLNHLEQEGRLFLIDGLVWQDDLVEQHLKDQFDDISDEALNDIIEEYSLRDLQSDMIDRLKY
jgi:predicted transcriptional regulator